MSGRTKGPWHIVEHMDFYGDPSKDVEHLMGFKAANGETVMWFGNAETYYPTEGDEPNQYDARLIAAAPELLEALETVRNHLVRLAWEENSLMIEGIDKAIKKAKGE